MVLVEEALCDLLLLLSFIVFLFLFLCVCALPISNRILPTDVHNIC